MRTFNDDHGEKWNLSIKIGNVEGLQSATGIDFLEPAQETEKFAQFFGSVRKRIDAVWELVKKDAAERGFPDRDSWLDRLSAESLGFALKALHEEIDFFIQSVAPKLAGALTKMIEHGDKMTEIQVKGLEKMLTNPKVEERLLREWDTALDKTMDRAMAGMNAELEKAVGKSFSAPSATSG